MKALNFKILLTVFFFSIFAAFIFLGAVDKDAPQTDKSLIIRAQVSLEANNIRTFIWNTGVFNQDMRTNNTPGFEWQKGTGKFAIFTTGLTIGAYVNNQLRLAAVSYNGELVPGYCVNGVLQTNANFKLYKVTVGDNQFTNPDWANWGLMVPFGAPFKDVNLNGTYEPATDIPGVIGATQTVFICLTDADPTAHTPSEGFGGGTTPLGAEVHMTAWCYNIPLYQDMQFLKWVVKNKNTSPWDSTLLSIVSDPDLGDATDDYVGCDTVNALGFCYNSDNQDGNGSGVSYGANPPAVGIAFLNCLSSNAKLTSFAYFNNTGSPGTLCENDPSNPLEAYNYMSGFKKDRTPWVNIITNQPTKFCYPGDPSVSPPSGWTEYAGRIGNCNGSLTGTSQIPAPPGDRRFVMNYKPLNQTINPGDSQVVMAVQLIARGSSNLNSLALLRAAAGIGRQFCQNGFPIGINNINSEIPVNFNLYQNYPNPFNPATKIKFDLPKSGFVSVKIYDAAGREIALLVNEKLSAGVSSVDWDASDYPSGVYFYRLSAGSFAGTKKMMLIK